MKFVCLLLLGLIAMSCNTIRTDYQEGADFSAFKTFAFHADNNTSGLNTQRAQNALIEGLTAKGLNYLKTLALPSPQTS